MNMLVTFRICDKTTCYSFFELL